MNKEDKKLRKHLVDEMMKVSQTNPDVMYYMEALMKSYEKLEQELERCKNIINTVRNCILTDISMLKTRRPEMSKEEIIMRLEATVKSLDKLKELKGE